MRMISVPEFAITAYKNGEGSHAMTEWDGYESRCKKGCGAKEYSSSSYPATDRRDPAFLLGYGDQRGLGSCPNNPADRGYYVSKLQPKPVQLTFADTGVEFEKFDKNGLV